MIDEFLTWKYHISFVCFCISRNTDVIAKLRYYLSIKQLERVYYQLFIPTFPVAYKFEAVPIDTRN